MRTKIKRYKDIIKVERSDNMANNKKKIGIVLSMIIFIILFLILIMYLNYYNKTNNQNDSSVTTSNVSNIISNSNIVSNSTINSNSLSNIESNATELTSNQPVQSNTTSNKSNSNSNKVSNKTSNKTSNKITTSNLTSNRPKPSNSNTTKPLTISQKVDNKLKQMTLDEKIGQMLIISFTGTSMSTSLKNELIKYQPGGVILFANNLGNYNTSINLVKNIQNTGNIPLFISIDQEGGKVQRLTSITGKSVTVIPPMYSVGKTNNTSLAYNIGVVIAEELRVFGINMDFAPVIDVLTTEDSKVMGNRSFGSNPTLVSNMGVAVANGLKSKGVIPVYKHFPGHGSTTTDSHYDLPVLTKTKSELYDLDLIPFQKAIKNGAQVIMIGHLAIPNITGDKTPASLSKTLITNILKKEMGYKGLVVTDALNMNAVAKNYSEKQIYEMAINAGVDILLMPKSSSSAISNIKQSIKEGKIKESQINESVRKILTLKYSSLKTNFLSTSYLGSSAHKTVVDKVK